MNRATIPQRRGIARRLGLAAIAVMLTAGVTKAQVFVPDDFELIAHYPLVDSPDEAGGTYPPMNLVNTTFQDSALFLNGIYVGAVEPGGYTAETDTLHEMDLTGVAISIEFKSDSVQFSPVVNGGTGFRWATIWVRTDSLVMLSLNGYNTILLSQLRWSTDTWHEVAIVINNDTASLWLDGVNGIHELSPTDTGEDRVVTFDHAGLGDAFYGSVRNLKVYTRRMKSTAAEASDELPTAGVSISIYPNPATPASRIQVDADRSVRADISVHDVLGRKVSNLGRMNLRPGSNQIGPAASNLIPGSYLVRVQTPSGSVTRPMVVAR